MTVYYFTIISVGLLCLLAIYSDQSFVSSSALNGESAKIKHTAGCKFLFILATGILILVAGLRYRVGTDYWQYTSLYYKYVQNIRESIKSVDEPGINIISWISSKIYNDYATMFFLSSLITIALMMRTIYKNTQHLLFATFIFIFMGVWHGSFNGVRQYLACAVLFCGIKYLEEKKLWKYLIIVLIAFCFHVSAIVMIIPFFFVHRDAKIKNLMLLLIGTVVVLFSYETVFEMVGLLKDDGSTFTSDYATRSVNIFRILVHCAPAVLALILYYNKERTDKENFYINLLFIDAVAMVATSNSAYLTRIAIYTSIYTVIALPNLIKLKDKNFEMVLKCLIIILYFVFWYTDITKTTSLSEFNWIWER